MSFQTGVWQQIDDFDNKFIVVFWIILFTWSSECLLQSHWISEALWCAISLIPITKPAASNLMLYQAVPDQCLFKVQLPILQSNLQTAAKFTQLLTFYRIVCYTKASAEFVLAIVNTEKNGQYPRGFMKNWTKSCQVDKITFHFQAQIAKQMLWSCAFFHEKELAAVRGFLAWPEEPVKHHALGGQRFRSQLSESVSTWLKTLSNFSASHRPDPDTHFGWQSSEYFCLFS